LLRRRKGARLGQPAVRSDGAESIVIMLASMITVELGVTVAVVEIALGVVAGNALGIDPPEWLDFLATFASVVLTAILPTLVAQRWFAPNQAQEAAR
jgi:ABC-type dipeptide/oligopeptide/nickel transport system permease component